MASQAYFDWIADGSPWRFSRPIRGLGDRLAAHGYTVYFEGNLAHLQHEPPEDHDPFSATGWPDPSPYPYCMAMDIMPPKPGQISPITGRPLPSLQELGAWLRADRLSGYGPASWLKYMNWEPSGDKASACYHESWQPDYARTTSIDRGHIHASCRSDVYLSSAADGYDLVARVEGTTVTTFGWDMSLYDAPSIGDAVSTGGIQFITHKAGGDKNDPELAAWWSAAKGLDPAKCMLGAYWVLYPGGPSGRADAFLARLDSQCPGWRDRPFILQADCEKWNGDPTTMPGLSDIKAFCIRLAESMPKLVPIVYAPHWAYGESLSGLGFPLWASAYVTTPAGPPNKMYPGDKDARWATYSGQVPAILQFTSSAIIGGQTTCDANAFRGTLAQLTALLAPGWMEDMPTAEEIATAVWATKIGNVAYPNRAALTALNDLSTDRDQRQDTGASVPKPSPKSPYAAMLAEPAAVAALSAAVTAQSQILATLLTLTQSESAEVPPSAQAIADAVLGDLNGQSAQETYAALLAVLGPEKMAAIVAIARA